MAFWLGALLSMAGALLQVLLRNPLAEPYILGISGGAGVATLIALLLGLVIELDTTDFICRCTAINCFLSSAYLTRMETGRLNACY